MVRYNRQERAWQVVDEADVLIGSFDPGPQGKDQAQRFEIKRQSEALSQLIERMIHQHPMLHARAVKGAMLLLGGHVYAPSKMDSAKMGSSQMESARDDVVANVQSQVNETIYTIHWIEIGSRHALSCSCQDWFNGYAQMVDPQPHISGAPAVGVQVWCKHLVAFMLGEQLGWPLSQLTADYA